MNTLIKPQFYHAIRFPRHLTRKELDELLSQGWFRMYLRVFTASHYNTWPEPTLLKLYWLRYAVDEVVDRRSHIRIRGRSSGFSVDCRPFQSPTADEEAFFSKYRSACGFDAYNSIQSALFGVSRRPSIFHTMALRVRDGSRLIAMGLFDIGEVSGASILHFYDRSYKGLSLGKYLMLLTIDWLKAEGFRYYYPGYIAPGNPRFDYKLFLGTEHARYYEQTLDSWVPFSQEIMQPLEYSKNEAIEYWEASQRYDKVVRPVEFTSGSEHSVIVGDES